MNELKKRNVDYIDKKSLEEFIHKGIELQGKYVDEANFIVRVNRNFPNDTHLLNGDICSIVFISDNKIIIRRLNDGYEGLVDRKYLSMPIWEPCYL